jgi:hypothetical protein
MERRRCRPLDGHRVRPPDYETPAFQQALGAAIRDFLGAVDDGRSDHTQNEHGVSVNRLARVRRAHATIGAANRRLGEGGGER